MQQLLDPPAPMALDRRAGAASGSIVGRERRQFADSRTNLSPEGRELAESIDSYKLMHRRRFIDCDELLAVIRSLGYAK